MVTLSESLLTLSAAARELPGPSGRGLHVSTLWRWAQRGVKGTRLETVMIGGIRYTSREALERFVARTTAAADGTTPIVRTPKQRQRAIEAAERELSEAGI
jgi:hypothetical protein